LVVERSAGSRFLPGYLAVPGGAVDRADDAHAARWFGTAEEGPRAAALRELTEEVGLALTADGAVNARDLEPIDKAPPDADALRQLCHWIAPPEVPVRFDARYFTVAVAPGAEPEPDGHEVAAAWWVSPRGLLDEWEAGERKLYWPTWFTVTELAGCASAEDVLALHFATREPTDHEQATMPRHVMEQD
jgi:8-oxo-dGTP pyrophosphatase MutT (NUDIX family)